MLIGMEFILCAFGIALSLYVVRGYSQWLRAGRRHKVLHCKGLVVVPPVYLFV